MSNRRRQVFFILAASIALSASACAGEQDCDRFVAAMVKLKHTPFRSETTIDSQDGPGHFALGTKSVFTGSALYTWKAGQWTWTAANGDELEAGFRKAQGAYTQTCHGGGSETIAGEVADILVTHGESDSVATSPVAEDARYWVSTKSGLTLKEEHVVSITTPHYPPSVLKFTTTYEYDDVRPPEE